MAKVISMYNQESKYVPLTIGEAIKQLSSYPREMEVAIYCGNNHFRLILENDIDQTPILMVESEAQKEVVCLNTLDAIQATESKDFDEPDLKEMLLKLKEGIEDIGFNVNELMPESDDHMITSLPGITAFSELKTKVLNNLCQALDSLSMINNLMEYDLKRENENIEATLEGISKIQPNVMVTKTGDIIGLEDETNSDDPKEIA